MKSGFHENQKEINVRREHRMNVGASVDYFPFFSSSSDSVKAWFDNVTMPPTVHGSLVELPLFARLVSRRKPGHC